MKKLLLLFSLIFGFSGYSFASVLTVTGHVLDTSGSAVSNGTITFALTNFGGNVPRVSGTGQLVKQSITTTSNSSGLFSVSIEGNDGITPSGTYYLVTFNTGVSAAYSFTGAGPINLDSYSALTTFPVPTGPVPSNILTSNNIFTNTNSFNIPLAQSSGGTGASTLAGANIPVQTGTITTGDCVKWASATTVADAGTCGAGGSVNAPADAIQYVSPAGNDSNTGLSWTLAKLTIYAAWAALAANTAGNVNAGGTIFVTNNAACGGPATGQGLQIIGPGDPNWLAFVSNNSVVVTAMSRTSNVVTVTLNAAPPSAYTVGATVLVSGASDSSFNGTFTISTVGASSFTYAQTAANGSVTKVTIVPNGWLVEMQTRIFGVGTNGWGANGHNPQAQLNCGSNTQPALWIAGTNIPLDFENVRFVGGPQAARLGFGSNNTTGSGPAMSGAQFKNTSFSTLASSGGPTVEIGTGSFWLFFYDVQADLNGNTCTTGADACEVIVLNPGGVGTGVGLTYFHDINLSSGDLKFSPGTSGGSVYVSEMTVESQPDGKGAVWFTKTTFLTHAVIEKVAVADATLSPTPAVEVDGTGPPDAVLVSDVFGQTQNVTGPATVLSQYPNSLQNIAPNPITQGQIDFFADKTFFQTDAGRRMFGFVASPFSNLASQALSGQTAPGGITYTSVAGPDGTNNAIRATNANTFPQNGVPFNGSFTYAVGDYIIGGVWVRLGGTHGVQNVLIGPTCAVTVVPLTPSANTSTGSSIMSLPYIKGDGEWEWFSGAIKITTAATGCYSPMDVVVPASSSTDYYAPVYYHIAAGTISDTEAAYIALHLLPYPDSLAPPVEATLRGHPIAFGGSGDNFFATLDHTTLTANQTYTLPNATGTLPVEVGAITTGDCVKWASATSISDAGATGCVALQVATPAAPTVVVNGTTGTTSYTYFVVAHDNTGGSTLASASGTTTTGNATLSTTNFNAISWTAVAGATSYDILKGTTATSLALSVPCCSVNDTGQATAVYTAPTVNTTAYTTRTQPAMANGRYLAGEPKTPDAVLYVSSFGSDTSDGLSWATAKLTLAAALAALPTGGGAVYVGGGYTATWSTDQFISAKSFTEIFFDGAGNVTITATQNPPRNLSVFCLPRYYSTNPPSTFQFINNTAALNSFNLGGPTGLKGVDQFMGCAFTGSGTGAHIYMTGPSNTLENNYFDGKQYAVQIDLSTSGGCAAGYEVFRHNQFQSTSDNINVIGPTTGNCNLAAMRSENNWYQKGVAGETSGWGINLPATSGFNGYSHGDQIIGTPGQGSGGFHLGGSQGFSITGCDVEGWTATGSFGIDASQASGVQISGCVFNAVTSAVRYAHGTNVALSGSFMSSSVTNAASIYNGSTDDLVTNNALGVAQSMIFSEQAAPAGVANNDLLWADSTAHRLKMSNNNGSASAVVGDTDVQTLSNKTLSSPALTTPTIGSGTAIARYARFSAALTFGAVAANSCAPQSFTLTGAVAGDILVSVTKPTDQNGLTVSPGHIISANNAEVNFCNVTAAAITPTAGETYQFVVVQ